ncbi:MAG: AGE family epimerase/isomerase, partial [Bacteroidota bacterium]
MNNQQFRQEIEREFHILLQWWVDHMVDGENGGFYGRMDGYSQLHPRANKGVILNTRLLWTFSAADHTGNAAYRKMADRAYQYLLDHFWDDQHGGVFWSVNYLGECTDATKQIYAQAFAIYALAEYYAISKRQTALDKAHQLFSLLEEHSRDKEKGGYLNVFSADWKMAADQRLSEKDEDQVK